MPELRSEPRDQTRVYSAVPPEGALLSGAKNFPTANGACEPQVRPVNCMKEHLAHFFREGFRNLRRFNYFFGPKNSIRLLGVPDELKKSVVIKFAETKDEYEQAFSLVYDTYLNMGVIKPNRSNLRLTLYHALPTTRVLVVKKNKTVISTLTTILDNPLGLPSRSIYNDEIESLGKAKLLEIGSFASETAHLRYSHILAFKLLTVTAYYVNYLNVDYVCATINPQYRRFYEKLCLMEEYGAFKSYTNPDNNINEAPTILMIFPFESFNSEEYRRIYTSNGFDCNLYEFFRAQDETSYRGVMSEELLRYFFLEKTDLFKTIEPAKLEYIKELYPTYDFNKVLR